MLCNGNLLGEVGSGGGEMATALGVTAVVFLGQEGGGPSD